MICVPNWCLEKCGMMGQRKTSTEYIVLHLLVHISVVWNQSQVVTDPLKKSLLQFCDKCDKAFINFRYVFVATALYSNEGLFWCWCLCEKKPLFMSVVHNWITLRYFIPYCSKEYFVKKVDLAITLVLSHSTVKVWVKSVEDSSCKGKVTTKLYLMHHVT